MAQRTVIGKNVWLFIRTGPSTVIPIKCLTEHTITASQEISNTVTKCGRIKAPLGDPDYQITGAGQIMLFTDADTTTNYSAKDLFAMLAVGLEVEVVSGPASGIPVEGDVTYSGLGYITEWENAYPAAEESTFTFTIDINGVLTQAVEGPTT